MVSVVRIERTTSCSQSTRAACCATPSLSCPHGRPWSRHRSCLSAGAAVPAGPARWSWSSWVGTIHRPPPYQDGALPLSYTRCGLKGIPAPWPACSMRLAQQARAGGGRSSRAGALGTGQRTRELDSNQRGQDAGGVASRCLRPLGNPEMNRVTDRTRPVGLPGRRSHFNDRATSVRPARAGQPDPRGAGGMRGRLGSSAGSVGDDSGAPCGSRTRGFRLDRPALWPLS